jgi:hypothetical protein
VSNHFATTITGYPLCWFPCISYLTNLKKCKGGENEKTKMYLAKKCFFHFYGYQNLSEVENNLKLKQYKGFFLTTEIESSFPSSKQTLTSLNFMTKEAVTQNSIPRFLPYPPQFFIH